MIKNYLIILNRTYGEVITIRLNREQKSKAKTFVNFEDYVRSLESRYRFRLENCSWMVTDNLHERNYL